MAHRLVHIPLKSNLPAWDVHMLMNKTGSCCCAVVRVSHAIGDGTSLAAALQLLADDDAASQAAMDRVRMQIRDAINNRNKNTSKKKMKKGILFKMCQFGAVTLDVIYSVYIFLTVPFLPGDAQSAIRNTKLHIPRQTVFLCRPSFDLARVRAVGKALGGATVNDIFNACFGGAIRSYIIAQTTDNKSEQTRQLNIPMRCIVPINLEAPDFDKPDDRLGNRFGLTTLFMSIAEKSAVERLASVMVRTAYLKQSLQAVLFRYLNIVASKLAPRFFYKYCARNFGAKTSVLQTNVKGPDEVIKVAGAAIKDVVAFVPVSGLGLLIFSYVGRVNCGFLIDRNQVTDPELFLKCFMEEWTALEMLAGPHESPASFE
eukprot:PhM_4_TR7142/c0_g2_i1/m.38956